MRQTTTETLMCFVMEGHHPLGAELLLNIQPRPPLSHIHAIPSGPVQNHRFLEHLKSEEDMFWEEKKKWSSNPIIWCLIYWEDWNRISWVWFIRDFLRQKEFLNIFIYIKCSKQIKARIINVKESVCFLPPLKWLSKLVTMIPWSIIQESHSTAQRNSWRQQRARIGNWNHSKLQSYEI